MAKYNGLFGIEGPIGNMTFYKLNGRHVARRRGGVSAQRIAIQ